MFWRRAAAAAVWAREYERIHPKQNKNDIQSELWNIFRFFRLPAFHKPSSFVKPFEVCWTMVVSFSPYGSLRHARPYLSIGLYLFILFLRCSICLQSWPFVFILTSISLFYQMPNILLLFILLPSFSQTHGHRWRDEKAQRRKPNKRTAKANQAKQKRIFIRDYIKLLLFV